MKGSCCSHYYNPCSHGQKCNAHCCKDEATKNKAVQPLLHWRCVVNPGKRLRGDGNIQEFAQRLPALLKIYICMLKQRYTLFALFPSPYRKTRHKLMELEWEKRSYLSDVKDEKFLLRNSSLDFLDPFLEPFLCFFLTLPYCTEHGVIWVARNSQGHLVGQL